MTATPIEEMRGHYIEKWTSGYITLDWFGLVSLFNGILTFVGYLMQKPFS